MDAGALIAECEPIVRHQAHLLGLRSGSLHLELDLRQHARIALWRAADQAPADDLHRIKWATVVIRNGVRDGLRTLIGHQGSAGERAERATTDDVPDLAQPCDAASLVAVRRLIERIADLPARQQRLVEAFVDGLNGAELAAEWGVTRSRVCQEAAEVREWVRTRLK
jgi:RNA polymerase sigma factor (sigma-70 family)